MEISIKKIILIYTFSLPILFSLSLAHLWPSYVINGISFLFIFLLIIVFFQIKPYEKLAYLLKSPIVWLILLFCLTQLWTILYAGNSLQNIRMVLSNNFYKVFIFIPVFLFDYRINDLIKHKKIIIFFFAIVLIGLPLQFFEPIGRVFSGIYYDGLPHRLFGLERGHSIFAVPSALVLYTTFFFLASLTVFKSNKIRNFSFLLIFFTQNRVAIALQLFVLFFHRFNMKKLLVLVVILILSFPLVNNFIDRTLHEMSYSEESINKVPRTHYTLKSLEIFQDYPLVGIGLRQFTSKYFWEKENYKWFNEYDVKTVFYDDNNWKLKLSGTDTGLVFLAEIGILGTIIISILFLYLFYLSKVVNNALLGYYVFFGIMYLYNITDPFNTYYFALPFWFIVGIFLNEYFYKTRKTKTSLLE